MFEEHNLELLSEQNYPDAMVILGDFYAYNSAAKELTLEQIRALSLKWYSKAAEKNHPAGLYLQGIGYQRAAGGLLKKGKVEDSRRMSQDAKRAFQKASDLGYDVNMDRWRQGLLNKNDAINLLE